MKRLYQWFSERASFFLSDTTNQGRGHTVRTEVTVQREAMTLLMSEGAGGFDICPICGQKVAPGQVGRRGFQLQKASTSRETGPVETPLP